MRLLDEVTRLTHFAVDSEKATVTETNVAIYTVTTVSIAWTTNTKTVVNVCKTIEQIEICRMIYKLPWRNY